MITSLVRNLSVLALMLPLLTSVGVAQQEELRYKELPNFGQVNNRLYRGGQPKKGGLERLALLGIKTVINLRGESEDTHDEEAEARRLGMSYFNVPMSNLGRPNEEQVSRVMAIIQAPENGPVFIHCRRGSDRTGAIIAIYRITNDGWTAKRAIEEAKNYGMSFMQFSKRDYISDYYDRRTAVGESR